MAAPRITPRTVFYYRPGPWLFAVHPFFTWTPQAERYVGVGWSVWWLWFEVARAA